MSRRIESKTSRTAEYTCLVRCLSYLEKREQYKSGDYVSLVIMNGLIRQLLHFPFFRQLFIDRSPAGMYEYVIARTKYFDNAFKQALENGVEQILIFGAGFDSRGIRLCNSNRNVRIFELEAPATQSVKIRRYRQKGIKIPENLIFIPIDFDRESLSDRLLQAGFKKERKCLFILEGLTMYLQPESIDSTFRVIKHFAGAGSRVIFDYIYSSVLRHEHLYDGEQKLFDNVTASGERFCFGIEKGHEEEFLSIYGFRPEKVLDGDSLQDMFFRDGHGELVGTVNKTHCIVSAFITGS